MRPELFVLAAWVVAFSGCPAQVGGGTGGGSSGTGGSSATGGGDGTGGSGGNADAGTPPPFAISGKGAVRFKRNIRLTTDFAIALGLPFDTVCTELGEYSCTLAVHPIALGGTDPYNSGLYEPLQFTGATSPIVVDRVALNACSQRMMLDVATPSTAAIYGGITIAADGTMDASTQAVSDAMDSLYERVLLRKPTADELATQRQLYTDLAATGKPDAAKSWMTLSCFTVLSSVESVFY